jgi:hypothetical protein
MIGAAAGLVSPWRTPQISPNHPGTAQKNGLTSTADKTKSVAKLQCRQCLVSPRTR